LKTVVHEQRVSSNSSFASSCAAVVGMMSHLAHVFTLLFFVLTSKHLFYLKISGVYDLTPFYQGHPGGAPRLLMAAGQDLEPYWEVYRQHLRGHVVDWMEKYRIGSLTAEETKAASTSFKFGDAYEDEPVRDPNLLPCTQKPFNGEPRIDLLTRDYITPNELFYVRNHLPVPNLTAEEYRLIVKGKGLKKHKFTLDDLKTKFKKHEVITTLQCAGNRREDLHNDKMREFLAPHWVVGAISTAKWGGPKLRDVLKECGLDVDAMALGELEIPGLNYVQFEAYDHDETGVHFGGSVPIEKAVDGLGDAILAYEMNGVPLPRDHGYPVRVILPGHAGCRYVHVVVVVAVTFCPVFCQVNCRELSSCCVISKWRRLRTSSIASISFSVLRPGTTDKPSGCIRSSCLIRNQTHVGNRRVTVTLHLISTLRKILLIGHPKDLIRLQSLNSCLSNL
jgi:DMSO/TMAO reductase YedYZ molybdopterin-dependent catalytic subunit